MVLLADYGINRQEREMQDCNSVTNLLKSRKPDWDRELRKLRRFAGARFGSEASKKFQARKPSPEHSHHSERWRHCNAAGAARLAGQTVLVGSI
jgi:hypothetical protein